MSVLEGVGQGLSDALWRLFALLRRMAESMRENIALLATSLLLSIILWAYVTNEANPPRTDIFPSPIAVAVRGQPPGTQLMNEPANVQVRVSAPADVWSRLRPNSFAAYVDLGGAAPGLVEREVRVETTEPQARVLEVTPDRVSVRLEAIARRQVPVRPVLEGALPFGFNYDPAQVTPNQVFVSGPASLVDRVEVAVANVRIEGSRVSISQTFPLYLVDAQGNRLSGVTVEPDSVTVNVEIVQQIHYRAISVSPFIRGTPAPGFWLRNVSVEPAVLTAVGDRATLEGITFLRTTPIDVTGLRADVQRLAEVELPRGVSLSGPNSVAINLSIASLAGTSRVSVLPTIVGHGPDTEAQPAGPVEVTLSGDLPTLQAVDPATVVATVDVTGLRPGVYEVAPRVTVPPGLTLVGVAPARVTVVIRAVAPAGGG
jgi:YbbR domain-containing protein